MTRHMILPASAGAAVTLAALVCWLQLRYGLFSPIRKIDMGVIAP
jgi:hypothetical protein